MIFLNRPKSAILAVVAFVALFVACEEDPLTIGSGVVGSDPFSTDKAVFDVFADNQKIKAVRTSSLPIYQLGVIDHPIYGKTEAQITSQVQLSSVNPIFGDTAEASEDPPENETVQSVVLYIPFLPSPSGDADNDGVIDELELNEENRTNPNSDTDGDGLTDNQEKARGTDPLNNDTDGDGVPDAQDEEFVRDQFAQNVDIDSIYGNRGMPFSLKLQRSDFFLRDLDPNTGFQESQEFFSDQDFSGFLTDQISMDNDTVSISEKQILVPRRDDPTTEDVDESTQFEQLDPGIRVELDRAFFQTNILDKEGDSELMNQANFKDFLRGIHFSIEPMVGEDLMMLFDLRGANITISYSYTAGEETKRKDFVLNFTTQARATQQAPNPPVFGNAVNTFSNDAYPSEIAEAIASEENAERIYLKGGAGSFAEINLFDDSNGRDAIANIKSNNWIVNEANLVFYVDGAPDVVQPPRLYLYNMETNAPLIGPNDVPEQSNALRSFPFYDGLLEGDGSTGDPFRYSIKITDYINDLVVRNATNATLGLTITPDIRIFNTADAMLENDTQTELPVAATLSPLGTVLFGSNVSGENSGRKLQLEIFYTEAN